ncbi:thiol:disulfide interchange protein DsbC [Thorsellia anophelis DSM 18579]|uniref:Thiol:disulfide interchange protein n=1 Tax=Thorsellia anophelis DSM 18579 TaxID=1123402 RepID=A0A1I0E1J9_9GAMM|nr:bifunctional protein-disulfide isomerase/oxidoreductase DsbC [Thorsellia anophelis]SET38947.1 thiol:disulfide interchange protein DsbC [Thorsellia anophelis DSM 18579]
MSFIRPLCIAVSLLCLSHTAVANEAIEKKLGGLGMTINKIEDSPIKGLKTVTTEQGVMIASEDGNYLFHGDLYDLTSGQPVNYIAKRLVGEVAKLSDQMITYRAKNEKFAITVFTDITCPYCQKMHQQMNEYNDLGITISYLAFPRQGPLSENAANMQSVWCMADKNTAFDKADKGEIPAPATCDFDIRDHYKLGNQMGVTGTPAILVPSGDLVPGYLPPKEMLAMLEKQAL